MRLALILLLFICRPVHAQIPEGYYTAAVNQEGETLKAVLHSIIKGHKEFPYSSKSTDVWDILKIADRDPLDSSCVIGIYSGFSMDAQGEYNKGSGWTREHIWAKSRGDFGTKKGAGTDLHHLRAADVSTNSARNNRNFECGGSLYIDQSGVYQGETSCYSSNETWSWEPPDEVKGDIARMLFYMAVRYEGEEGEPDLELTDLLLDASSKEPLQAKVSVLLQWHLMDPVCDREKSRNDIVFTFQGNRNPFIDHPEFVALIWMID